MTGEERAVVALLPDPLIPNIAAPQPALIENHRANAAPICFAQWRMKLLSATRSA